MRYRIRVSAEADWEIPRLPGHVRQRFRRLITSLCGAPRPSEALELRDLPGHYRIRIGRWRLIYQVDVGILRACVKTGPEIYENLPGL